MLKFILLLYINYS